MSAALRDAQAEAESYRRAWLREEGLARAWKARDDFSQKALEEMTLRALAAEAALLTKSAEYDALVARVEAAPEGYVAGDYHGAEHGGIIVMDYVRAPVGQRIRLLVSDDRPSHTAGENDA